MKVRPLNVKTLEINRLERQMTRPIITRQSFLQDRQGKTFADVLNDPEQPIDDVLDFFNDEDRQRRMVESEIHHNRSPLAGVVRDRLAAAGLDTGSIYDSGACTACNPVLFFSHRREDGRTGRHWALARLEPHRQTG